jgi:transcriptional regulator with XRE-family HTH domain
MNNILKNIKLIRQEKGLSQENIAEELDLTASGYAQIEQGKINLTVDRLYELAGIFKMSVEEIINYPNKPRDFDGVEVLTPPKIYLQIELQPGSTADHILKELAEQINKILK